MFRKIIGCIITLLLIIFGVNRLGYIVRPTVIDGAYQQIATFHDLPRDSIEVICFGSSHAFRGINIMELYDNYGIGAYNYSWNWQGINTTRQFIGDAFLTQKPKLVIIETYYVGRVLENTNIESEIYYSRYLNVSEKDYLKQCFGDNLERYISYYMPLCAFHDNWVNINRASFETLSKGAQMYKNMGYSPSENISSVTLYDPNKFKDEESRLSENSIVVLDDIVRMCHENGAEVLFVTIPYEGAFLFNDAMSEYANTHGCSYINFFYHIDDLGLDAETDFSDKGHLNLNGATKVSDYIGEYIHTHYELSDMRTIENNIWENAKAY